MQAEVLSKSAFAALIGVSPGRVSQYLADGQITPAALVGSGQRAKIHVERARADLRLSLDVSQRLGNGHNTRLDPAPGAAPVVASESIPSELQTKINIDFDIKKEKLDKLQRDNRNAAIEDAKARGRLTNTDDARNSMGRVAAAMLEIFEGGLSDLSMAVAAEFKLPQRDVKHLMRREFRKVRETAHRQMQQRAIEMPETVTTHLEVDDPEGDEL